MERSCLSCSPLVPCFLLLMISVLLCVSVIHAEESTFQPATVDFRFDGQTHQLHCGGEGAEDASCFPKQVARRFAVKHGLGEVEEQALARELLAAGEARGGPVTSAPRVCPAPTVMAVQLEDETVQVEVSCGPDGMQDPGRRVQEALKRHTREAHSEEDIEETVTRVLQQARHQLRDQQLTELGRETKEQQQLREERGQPTHESYGVVPFSISFDASDESESEGVGSASPCRVKSLRAHLGASGVTQRDIPRLSAPYPISPRATSGLWAWMSGLRALEIGGPTPWIDWYTMLQSADNVVEYDHDGVWARMDKSRPDEFRSPFTPELLLGRRHLLHGARLHGLEDHSYSLVIASHSLEHFEDPLSALQEWDRVLEPGGSMVLVLPWKDATFDRHRPVTNFQHLLQDYKASEQRLRHDLESIIMSWDVWADGGLKGDEAQRRARLRERMEEEGGSNMMHWHVFDFDLLQACLECLGGYQVVQMELFEPYHQVVVAVKPIHKPHSGS